MIREELGHGAGHEEQATELAPGIGRDSRFLYSYGSIIPTLMLVNNF